MKNDIQGPLEKACKNCSHPVSIHKPNCLFKSEEDSENICKCKDPQYYNSIVSDKYIGWVEIHCNSCGKKLGLMDSTVENIYDYNTVCFNCILKLQNKAR